MGPPEARIGEDGETTDDSTHSMPTNAKPRSGDRFIARGETAGKKLTWNRNPCRGDTLLVTRSRQIGDVSPPTGAMIQIDHLIPWQRHGL